MTTTPGPGLETLHVLCHSIIIRNLQSSYSDPHFTDGKIKIQWVLLASSSHKTSKWCTSHKTSKWSVRTWIQIYLQVMVFSPFSIELQTQPNSEKITMRIRKMKFFSQWGLIYSSWINNAKKRLTINTLISTLDMEVILILDLLYNLPFNKTRAYQKTSLQTSGLWRSYYTSSHSL